MKTKQAKQRVFPREIKPIASEAPWFSLNQASKESGVSISTIKEACLPVRRFGRADYVRTQALNAWIIKGETPEEGKEQDEKR